MNAFDCPQEEFERGARNSLLSEGRLFAIGAALKVARTLPGDTAEVGVAAGGTTRLIAVSNGGKRHWACDTFDGLVDVGKYDGELTNRMFQNVLPKVREELEGLENVRIVPGYFPVSAPPTMQAARFSFVHIDVDTYLSIRNCFEFFAARMVPGGLVALDDVLPPRGTLGAMRAWREIGKEREVFSLAPPQIIVRFP